MVAVMANVDCQSWVVTGLHRLYTPTLVYSANSRLGVWVLHETFYFRLPFPLPSIFFLVIFGFYEVLMGNNNLCLYNTVYFIKQYEFILAN